MSMLLAKQTVFGAAKLALEIADTPSALREQVTSPNGTTAAALEGDAVLVPPSEPHQLTNIGLDVALITWSLAPSE